MTSALQEFLSRHGWALSGVAFGDSSSRRYHRVHKEGAHTAILMEMTGRTPGHDPADFIRIAQWIRQNGLSAPEIYEVSGDLDFILMEDFGDTSFKSAILSGQDAQALYALAAQVQDILAQAVPPSGLPPYAGSHVDSGHRRVIDWYAPAMRGRMNEDGLLEAYLAAWNDVMGGAVMGSDGFTHIDFHVQNLMWLPGRDGLKRCGILDFQGAMLGPCTYDLGNLLEDARIAVPPVFRAGILKGKSPEYLRGYRILTTQFHCRVLGQFIKLALNGKPQYLEYIPVVRNYMREALKDPALRPLAQFFMDSGLDFEARGELNIETIRPLIRPDAY